MSNNGRHVVPIRVVDPDFEPLTIGELPNWFEPISPEEAARLVGADDLECGGPDLRQWPVRPTPRPAASARRPLPLAYWIAIGFCLSILIILGFLWLYVSSLEAQAPGGRPSSPARPAALVQERFA